MYIAPAKSKEGVVIDTPIDDPTQFSPSWRAELAHILATDGRLRVPKEYKEYQDDDYVKGYTDYLRTLNKAKDPNNLPINQYTYALRWHEQSNITDTKYKLEPLLLTTAPFNVISKVLAGDALDEEPFRTYERLFFNIRNDDGTLHRSCHLRTHFALPQEEAVMDPSNLSPTDIWRFVGSHGGYQALCRLWLWADAPEFTENDSKYLSSESWWLAQATMMDRLVRRNIKNQDLIGYMERYTDGERLKLEAKTEEGNTKIEMAFLELLKASAPKMMEISKTVDDIARDNEKLSEKRQKMMLTDEEAKGQGQVEPSLNIQEVISGRFAGLKAGK